MKVMFCKECSNLLHPKIEEDGFVYNCIMCDISTSTPTAIMYDLDFQPAHYSNVQYKENLCLDATLPRFRKKCSKCGKNECIGYMENCNKNGKALNYYYVCVGCYHEWED